jgi:hypothetical protein
MVSSAVFPNGALASDLEIPIGALQQYTITISVMVVLYVVGWKLKSLRKSLN